MSDEQSSPRGGWVYDRPTTESEEKVRSQGYSWVSTSSFKSGDKLGYHGHGSANTHLFITGRCFLFAYDIVPKEGQRAPPSGERSSFSGPVGEGNFANMQAGEMYSARVETDCDFVEGHRCLSPSTRDRFLLRNSIKWSENENHAGPVSPEVEAEGRITL